MNNYNAKSVLQSIPKRSRAMFSRRNALWCLLFAGLGSAVWFVGCSRAPDPWESKPTPHVLVSVPPLYSFAKSVAGNHGDVKCLCTENGPHHFDYSQTDLFILRGATRYFTIGLNLDDKFSDKMMKATETSADKQIELGEKLPKNLQLAAGHEHDEKEGKKDEHDHGDIDPHVWLGTPQAIQMVEMIRDELKKADPANAADYDKNAAAYVKELKKLHEDGLALLKGKTNKKIISFHESLGYFAKEFGIDIVDVIEDIPSSEPDISKIRKLVNECKEKDVRVIAVEPQYPTSTSAAALLKELKDAGKTDVQLVEIDPLETAAAKDLAADLYIKTMRMNLENLAKSLP
jgi:zinc transport system substrate-binding protein